MSAPIEDSRPDAFLGYTVVRLAHLLERRNDRRMRNALGISIRQFGALAQLQQDPGISSAKLARLLLITPQSAGPLVEALAVSGLIHRDLPPRNGARMRVSLTPDGQALLARGYAVMADVNAADFAQVTEIERSVVNALLLRVVEKLEGDEAS